MEESEWEMSKWQAPWVDTTYLIVCASEEADWQQQVRAPLWESS